MSAFGLLLLAMTVFTVKAANNDNPVVQVKYNLIHIITTK